MCQIVCQTRSFLEWDWEWGTVNPYLSHKLFDDFDISADAGIMPKDIALTLFHDCAWFVTVIRGRGTERFRTISFDLKRVQVLAFSNRYTLLLWCGAASTAVLSNVSCLWWPLYIWARQSKIANRTHHAPVRFFMCKAAFMCLCACGCETARLQGNGLIWSWSEARLVVWIKQWAFAD